MSLFITFEGLDGSGKSTQLQRVQAYLEQREKVYCTREPGGTLIGDKVRQILLNPENKRMAAEAEILLYSASRAQLVAQEIIPYLNSGAVVLCDRYIHSTYAYQGYGRRLDFSRLRQITEFAIQKVQPDLVICLDLAVSEAMRRKRQAWLAGTGELNRMDRLDWGFYQRVRAGYLEMAQAELARWLVIDATTEIEVLNRIICRRIDRMLEKRW